MYHYFIPGIGFDWENLELKKWELFKGESKSSYSILCEWKTYADMQISMPVIIMLNDQQQLHDDFMAF